MTAVAELTVHSAFTPEQLDELLLAGEESFGAPFVLIEEDEADATRFQAFANGVQLASTENGVRVRLTIESPEGERLTLESELDDLSSDVAGRLGRSARRAMQTQLRLSEQERQLERHTAQVSHDFDMLVSMRELAERMQRDGLSRPPAEVIESLLPCLADMLRATETLSIEVARSADGPMEFPSVHLSRVHRFGRSTLSDATILDLISARSVSESLEPIVLNDGAIRGDGVDRLSSIILVALSGTSQTEGWLIATRHSDDWQPGSPLAAWHDHEFGTIEAGLLMSVATFLSSHCRNVQLFKDQERLLVGVVRAMVNAIDAKDSYTCGHSDRVALVSRLLAQEMGLHEVECDRIYLTGLLHDIGKIGVPDNVLQKPSKLTDDEFALIKKHPLIGYNVLSHLDEISYVLPGVLHHHESLDGKGYPSQLRGIEIPLDARILAVADSFDAMTSTRPYRQGMSLEKASGILQSAAGTQWDANVVSAFFRCRDKIVEACRLSDEAAESDTPHDHDDSIARAVMSGRAR